MLKFNKNAIFHTHRDPLLLPASPSSIGRRLASLMIERKCGGGAFSRRQLLLSLFVHHSGKRGVFANNTGKCAG